jgi:hypothetical protein
MSISPITGQHEAKHLKLEASRGTHVPMHAQCGATGYACGIEATYQLLSTLFRGNGHDFKHASRV